MYSDPHGRITESIIFVGYSLFCLAAALISGSIIEQNKNEISKAFDNIASSVSKGFSSLVDGTKQFFDKITISKAKEEVDAKVITKEPGSPVVFPVDPNDFNPVGLVKVPRAGTKNGAFISWMDPLTNTEVFRWDENPNYSNGSHYHILGTGHYYPGTIVPEPYATIYFPFK